MNREELDKILDGRRIVVSVSGGKDSTACCLYLMEMGYEPDEFDRIFFDTGWEHPLLYEYVRQDLPDIVGPIESLYAEIELDEELVPVAEQFEKELGVPYSSMVRLVLRKGMFPSRQKRWCTDWLKVRVSQKYFHESDVPMVNVVGIRAEESKARALMTEWEFAPKWDLDVWRPLIDWSTQQVIDIHQRHGVRPCRLYLEQNADRVGCYPCIYSRKAEIRQMSDYTPERIDLIERLEEVVKGLAEKRYAAQGETFESLNMAHPGWFQTPKRTYKDDGSTSGECWPIRKVVSWSRTTRGGHMDQMELFTDPLGHQGCVRWGMCDTGTK